MSETAGEKNFAPTEKRKRDAAQKGDVLRSRELPAAAVVMLGGAWLSFAGPWLLTRIATLLRTGFIFGRDDIAQFSSGASLLGALFIALPIVASIAVPAAIAVLVLQLAFGQGRWVGKNLTFKGSRINPLAGLKRMFGPNGLIEMGKGLLKVALLGAIAIFWARSWLATVSGIGRGDIAQQLTAGWGALISLFFALAAGLVIIAAIDWPVQWLRRMKRLRMSHQQMRDEHKESDGSPEAKAARRQRQRDIAAGSVAGAMREAQFLLTNPSHFAVAMTYDLALADAPVVLAKGRGDKAAAMRELALELAVPMLDYPQLARSVYFTTREHQTIREELYAAVARVLAFVLSLKRGEHPAPPLIEVPPELRFDADGRLMP